MSKNEHSNNLASAVTHGNNQQLIWASYEDQLKAEGCKRLIMNAINYFNLLLLSEKLSQCKTEQEKQSLLAIIAKSSTHTWRHINLLGMYDFSDTEISHVFDLQAIMALKLTR